MKSFTHFFRSRKKKIKNIALSTRIEQWTKKSFEAARLSKAPSKEKLPLNFQLRKSAWPRRCFETLFPVRHIFRLGFEHEGEVLGNFMPITKDSYIGRGSYKFVYSLPWQMVVKVSKEVLPSNPLFGSSFQEVTRNPEDFLSAEEMALWSYLKRGRRRGSFTEKIDFKFHRLGLERYHYWKVRDALPDIALDTRFWMGARYRAKIWNEDSFSRQITPMDSQIMLAGKHLKEFARSIKKRKELSRFYFFKSRFEIRFDNGLLEKIKEKALRKAVQDFQRLIQFTEELARKEKLILDIHAENIILSLPDFRLKIFDFHLFDESSYYSAVPSSRGVKEHIELIEEFVQSFRMDSNSSES